MITHKLVLALVAAAGVGSAPQPGTWQRLPSAPIAPEFDARTSVWTGKEMLVFGRDQQTALDASGQPYATGAVNVAAAYNPATRTWRRLAPPRRTSGFMRLAAVWTGREMLVWGQGTRLAYNPRANTWRRLPGSRLLAVHDGFGAVVWTGKEMLGWGGGCCGDSFSDGVAYSPATNSWRALPRAPLSGSQHPLGVWSGKEYIVVAGGRAAAYSPARNAWRKLPTPPAGARTAVWTGSDVVVTTGTRRVFALQPMRPAWRPLPLLPAGRVGDVLVWDGAQLLVWGGRRGGASFVPGMKEWTVISRGPLPARLDATAVWTGSALLVWGGVPTKTWGKYDEAGAALTPPALGCGDDWSAQNLVVTKKLKDDLRAAFGVASLPRPGATYYGSYSGTFYAVATFGRTPTIFRTDGQGLWRIRQKHARLVCTTVVPRELIAVWSLRRVSRTCYALRS